ncbi:alpha/beta hydrolase [Arenibaculum pallidiluteum]|uniref:alpha/beta hydrolase n=1 Tax=Arenibaculum pallidiluteum TaxID=2812559 RepID=UPI001A95A0BF|nr:alpha/beta hydrolase [Arenibaculum pallidiluteum]
MGEEQLFRYYGRAELERQCSARGTVADIGPIMAEYAARTRAARESLPCALDIPYGPTGPERLDVYPAASAGPAPVFVFVHGGYWRMLDAADSGFMAPMLTRAGACVVAVNYALAPEAALDEIVRQCRAALAWVHANIARHGGDPGRIHLAGSSAGAHLATMMAAPGWQDAAGLPADAVKGLTLMSGLYDLTPVRLAQPNEWLRLDEAAARRNSPIHAPPRPPIPVIVTYAPSDTEEFRRQSEAYLAACAAAGCDARFVPAPGTNHFDIVFELCRRDGALARAVLGTMGL